MAYADGIKTIGNVTHIEHEGELFEVRDGAVYKGSGTTHKISDLYDPNFVAQNYLMKAGKRYRIVEGFGEFEVNNHFEENFENATTIRDLVSPSANWHSMLLQSPAAPTVEDYVSLRHDILHKGGDFVDNRIDVSHDVKHSGSRSARFYAVKPSWRMSLTKANLENELIFLEKGQDFWFSGWFFLEQGRPIGLIDLESSYMDESPGIRVLMDESRCLRVELKFATKPTFNVMDTVSDCTFPLRQWVKIEMHIFLSDDDGRVELWLDDKKMIDSTGRTLVLFDAIYDRLQVGITANPKKMDTVLYVDDIRVSDRPFAVKK